jgi:hypothetical protein
VSPHAAEIDPSPYHWVACSEAVFGPVGRKRHLAKARSLTTVCGNTASVPSIWRKNTRKPKCATCEAAEGSVTPPEEGQS